MFDEEVDVPQNAQTQEPSIDDIPDIFDGATMPDASPETTVGGPSALDAGKFQRLPDSVPTSEMQMETDVHEPSMVGRILIALGILVVVVVVGAGAWFVKVKSGKSFTELFSGSATPTPSTETKTVETTTPLVQTPEVQTQTTSTPSETPTDLGGNVDVTEKPLSPEEGKVVDVDITVPVTPGPVLPTPTNPTVDSQKDTDKDGLTDVREAALGTNANNPDTDADGLTDGSEVTIWKTNPLLSDTDGDGYPDGQEVLNNFNPNGPGKLR